MSHNFPHASSNSKPFFPSFGYNSVEAHPDTQNYAYLQHGQHSGPYDHDRQYESIPMEQMKPQPYSHVSNHTSTHQSARWEPGFWCRFPIWSILSMFAVLICLIIALYILVASDGKPVDSWGYNVAPAVYLAITSMIANSLLAFALVNGLVISFWRTALHGASLSELSRNYECGHSLRRATWAGFRRGGRITALACILTVVGLLRGPLNQRASTVETDVRYETQGSVQLNVAKQLPDGFTGISQTTRTSAKTTARLTSRFNSVMQEYSARSAMKTEYHKCGEWCRTSVRGFGFNATCGTYEYTTSQQISGFTQPMFSTRTTIYQIGNELSAGQRGWNDTGIKLNATYFIKQGSGLNSTMNFVWRSHICNLTGGTTTYDIQLEKNAASITSALKSESFEKIKLESPSNMGLHTTIGGFQFAMSYLFDSTATLSFGGAVSSVTLEGALASQMFIENSDNWVFNTYNDPMKIMLDALQEITFRASLRAGKDNGTETDRQTVPYRGYGLHTVYRTNNMYMGAAAAVSIVSLFAVAATFWGWWELGRDMTLSPLEIAKAFDSPLLKQAGSNVPAGHMSKSVLATRIRYGECVDYNTMQTGYNGANEGGNVSLGFRPDAGKPRRGYYYGS